jgi:hypothetical protein
MVVRCCGQWVYQELGWWCGAVATGFIRSKAGGAVLVAIGFTSSKAGGAVL